VTVLPVHLATAFALLAAPATASAAPVLTPLRACYDAVSDSAGGTEPVTVAASGFEPGTLVDVAVDGEVKYAGVQVADDGTVSGSVFAPFVAKGRRPFSVTVTQQGVPEVTARADSLVTRLAVRLTPRSSRPSARVRFRGSGFTAPKPIYLHYVRKGKLRRTVRLVKHPAGPCGGFDVRRRQFPFAPSIGRWILQIDQQRRYHAEPSSAYLQLAVDIRARRRH
jgi:hypothetical protein